MLVGGFKTKTTTGQHCHVQSGLHPFPRLAVVRTTFHFQMKSLLMTQTALKSNADRMAKQKSPMMADGHLHSTSLVSVLVKKVALWFMMNTSQVGALIHAPVNMMMGTLMPTTLKRGQNRMVALHVPFPI